MPGVTIWHGNSYIDGKPIVALLTYESSNDKTGNIPQTWILRQDINPLQAITERADVSICGNCAFRGLPATSTEPAIPRSCYVVMSHAPMAVWRAWRHGRYPWLWDGSRSERQCARRIADRPIRWGSYGDPALIPEHIVDLVEQLSGRHGLGYTHQWREPWAAWAKQRWMASVLTDSDHAAAKAMGWATYRVRPKGAPSPGGRRCPHQPSDRMIQCRSCRLCDGQHGDIWEEAHGNGAKHIALLEPTLALP